MRRDRFEFVRSRKQSLNLCSLSRLENVPERSGEIEASGIILGAERVPAMLAKLSIPAALAASAIVGLVLAQIFMGGDRQSSRSWLVTDAGAQSSSRTIRPGDAEAGEERRLQRPRTWDCHRDVRTHRIDGVMVRHRHVGENCEVRVVRQSSEPR